MKEIYLDNASTTKVDEKIADYIYEIMTKLYGNPSSVHNKGLESYNVIYNAKKSIANLICCSPENIIFTSGGTESNNLAILGSINLKSLIGKNIISSVVEHSSVFDNMKKIESLGCKVHYVKPTNSGDFNYREIWNLVNENTVLVSIMNVNNETGNIYNIKEIAKGIRYKNKKTIIHSDGVQAFGKMNVNVIDLDVDLYSFSGHKVHSPKGIGGLYIKDGIRLKPLIIGGNQEHGFRAGTENVPGISGIGRACDFIDIDKNLHHVKKLYDLLFLNLANIKNIHINSNGNILPYILNFSIKGQKSEVISNKLQQKNIFISNGSACSKGKNSRTLKGMELENKYIDGAVRVSFSKYNNEDDINNFICEINKISNLVD